MKYFYSYYYDDYSHARWRWNMYIRQRIRNVIMVLNGLTSFFSWVNTLLTKCFSMKVTPRSYRFTRLWIVIRNSFISRYSCDHVWCMFSIDFNINVCFFLLIHSIVSDDENDLIYELAITLINCIARVMYIR